jgi:hypothetical protein
MTPNEARVLEDRDTIEGGDFLAGPATLLKSDNAVEFPDSPARASRRAEGLALDLISLRCLRLLARDRKQESKGIPG